MKYLFFALLSLIIFTPNIAQAQNNAKLNKTTQKESKEIKALYQVQKQRDSLQKLLNAAGNRERQHITEINRLKKISKENELLVKYKFRLEDNLYMVEDQRDSLQKLLNNTRYRERRYRKEAIRLHRLLENSEGKIDSLQKAYNEIAAGSGSLLAEYRKQIEQLTTERNSLASDNQRLQRELAKSNKSNQIALFSLEVQVVPGRLSQGRFQTTTHARETDRIQVTFILTRAPSTDEKIIVKLLDVTNREVPLINNYQAQLGKPTPTNQMIIIEPAISTPRKLSRGNYYIRLFLTNKKQGIINQSIGIAKFSLR